MSIKHDHVKKSFSGNFSCIVVNFIFGHGSFIDIKLILRVLEGLIAITTLSHIQYLNTDLSFPKNSFSNQSIRVNFEICFVKNYWFCEG